ncbi:hypothetical protein EZS27_026095 [termite gut metagenome]|uniref:Uncharacterized protein n=1 Tax=termite gut metagenome TaxID=433724 RepID=A0A5J4QU09_9ZZZZ
MNKDDTAKKLQSMVTLGIPDTRLSGQGNMHQPVQDVPPEDESKKEEPAFTVRPRKRKDQPEDYRETYFKRIDFSDRQPLYITRATHEKLMLIVSVVGGRKATISSYVEKFHPAMKIHAATNNNAPVCSLFIFITLFIC